MVNAKEKLRLKTATGSPAKADRPARERILEAARTQFAAHGLRGARLDAVAREAGCTKGLVIHHFGGKQQLWEAVLSYYLGMGRNSPFLSLSGSPDRQQLEHFLRRSFRFFQTHPDFSMLSNRVVIEPGSRPPAEMLSLIRNAGEAFAHAQHRGLIRADVRPRQAHLMTYCLIAGWFTYRDVFAQAWDADEPGDTDDQEFLEAMLVLLDGGLLSAPGPGHTRKPSSSTPSTQGSA